LFSLCIFTAFVYYLYQKKESTINILKKLLILLSGFNLVLFIGLRSMWWGIEKTIGVPNLQYLILILLIVLFILSVVALLLKKLPNLISFINLSLSIIFYIVIYYIVNGSIGSIMFVTKDTFDLISIILFFIVLFLIFKYVPHIKFFKLKQVKYSILGILSLLVVLLIVLSTTTYFTVKPVVYAVNDEYQIVWSTSNKGSGEVIIGDKSYYDTVGGSIISNTTIHKVNVPQKSLDFHKKYTVKTQQVFYRGPYGGIKGRTISITSEFKPVDISDGLNYYSISDTHDFYKHVKINIPNLDFVILLGDHASFIDREEDLLITNKLGYSLSKGIIPLVYARGNHEVKGVRYSELPNYVGSNNTDFFYTFNLSGVYGIVLDMVEDHSDSWYEFYMMAKYHEYRLRQLDFLESVYAKWEDEKDDIKFKMVISHVPINLLDKNDQIKEDKLLFIDSLQKFNLDVSLSGHKHILLPILSNNFTSQSDMDANYDKYYHTILKGATVVKTNYNSFIVSRRSYSQEKKFENEYGKYMIGMHTEVSPELKSYKITYLLNDYTKVLFINPLTGNKEVEMIFPLL
jgi:hypothetical protein